MSGRRILVTGAAGFIGSGVVAALVARGDEVIGLDDINDAYDVRLKEWRLRQLETLPRFTFLRGDIRDRAALAPLFAGPGLSAVVNLAARAGVRPSVTDPWIYLETNVTGALHLLDLCREHGVPKFVFASSSSVYGDAGPGPFREEGITDRPRSPYAASKKAGELLAHTYRALHGIDVAVLRYFTVYGPAGRPDMALFRFVQRVREGRPITVYGDGNQERDFTYVDDIVRGTLAALDTSTPEPINLGSDRPVRLGDAIRLVEERLGKRAVIERAEPHPADVKATWADITRARERLSWEPRVRLEEGVEALVRWYEANREWAREIVTA